MSKELKIEDFEVVKETEPMNGCAACYFYTNFNGCKRCMLVFEAVGAELEQINGDCGDEGHHYKLKNKE